MSKVKCRCNPDIKRWDITCGDRNCKAYMEFDITDCKIIPTYTLEMPDGGVLKGNGYDPNALAKESEKYLKELNGKNKK